MSLTRAEIDRLADEAMARVFRRTQLEKEEIPQEVADARERWKEIERRAAVAQVFDAAMYQKWIGRTEHREFDLEQYLRRGDAERMDEPKGYVRVRKIAPQDPSAAAPEAHDVVQLHADLAAEWRTRVAAGANAIWSLPHLLRQGGTEPAETLRKLVEDALAPGNQKLDRAEQVLAAAQPYLALMSDGTKAEFERGRRRFWAAKLFAPDYYKSARYFRRRALHEQAAAFLQSRDWLLPISAAGGSGKTMFLRNILTREWLPAETLVARVDFDHTRYDYLAHSPWLILLPLAEQLAQQLGPDGFTRILGRKESWAPYLAPQRQAAAPLLNNPEGPNAPTEEEGLVYAEDWARTFVSGLPGGRQVIFVFDTTEEPYLHGGQPFHALLTLFHQMRDVATRREGWPGIRVLLSGRYDLFGRKESGEERVPGLAAAFDFGRASTLEIRGFTYGETAEVLSSVYCLSNLSEAVKGKVFKASCSGDSKFALPFDVALWGRELSDHPDWTEEHITRENIDIYYLVERVLERIPDQEVRWLVRYTALLRRVDPVAAQEVILDEVRLQLARSKEAAQAVDDANAGFKKEGVLRAGDDVPETARKATRQEVWDKLLKYAAGPEEGWINPDPDGSSSYVLHARVIQPMRRLVERQPAWKTLHAAVQSWFEERAQNDPPNAAAWNVEALYHAFQHSPSRGRKLWRRLTAALHPGEWETAAKYAAMVLGEAGFDTEDGAPVALLNLHKKRRVAESVEKLAAEGMLWAALWQYALEDSQDLRLQLRSKAKLAGRRWQQTQPSPEHHFHAALRCLPHLDIPERDAVGDLRGAAQVLTVAISQAPSRSDILLLRLLLARVLEQSDRTAEALVEFAALTTQAVVRRRSTCPVGRHRLVIIKARAMARLAIADKETALALDRLASSRELTEEEQSIAQLEGARAWMSIGRPKKALDLLGLQTTWDEPPAASHVQMHFLRVECLIALDRIDDAHEAGTAAEPFLQSAKDASADRNRLENMRLRAAIHSARLECQEASSLWSETWTRAADNQTLHDLAWRACLDLARHKFWVEQSARECSVLLDTLGSLALDAGPLVVSVLRGDRELAIAALRLEIDSPEVNVGRTGASTDALKALENIAAHHPPHSSAATARLLLAIHGNQPMDGVVASLRCIEPPSARPRALTRSEVDTAGTGSGNDSASDLFDGAFVDDPQDPPGATSATLDAATFLSRCGNLEDAWRMIVKTARSASKEKNHYLWRKAAQAAFSQNRELPGSAPAPPKDSPLDLAFLIEKCERLFHFRFEDPVSAAELRATHRQILKHRAVFSPAMAARLSEINARVAEAGHSSRAAVLWSQAASMWESLGQRARAETCRRSASAASQRKAPPTEDQGSRVDTAAATINPDDMMRLFFEHGKLRAAWRDLERTVDLPQTLARVLSEKSQRMIYSRILKLSDKDGNLAVLDEMFDLVPQWRSTYLGLVTTESAAAGMLPWELSAGHRHPEAFRTDRSEQAATGQSIQWIQRSLALLGGLPSTLLIDGIAGPLTLRALEMHGFQSHSTPSISEVMRWLRSALPTLHFQQGKNRPVCVLNLGDLSHSMLDILYQGTSIEAPKFYSIPEAGAFVRQTHPSLFHIRGSVTDRSDSGQVTLGTSKEIMRVDHILNWLKIAGYPVGGWPVILVDVPLQYGDVRENQRVLLQRNHFCQQLWSSGMVAAIIATSSERSLEEPGVSNPNIPDFASKYRGVAETSRMLRSTGGGGLAEADALWAIHPEWPLYWPI